MSDTLVYERIEANLTRLRLPRIREILGGTIHAAEEQSKSYLSFLDDLLEEEVARRSSAGLKPRSRSRACPSSSPSTSSTSPSSPVLTGRKSCRSST
jgi:DNA replication protein DnaC